jgi:predicted enzyme related to lactoylglutathione lyase
MTASVAHWQILTADPERVASFYGDLFGWSVSAANAMGYRELGSAGDGGIDGGIWPAPPGATESVQVYVAVDDIEASLERIQRLGGSVLMEKQVLPDGDAMALALDPLGRSFGLMTTAGRP